MTARRESVTRPPLVRAFHVSARAREEHGLDTSSFDTDGMLTVDGSYAARILARKLEEGGVTASASAGQLNALATVTGILGHVLRLYAKTVNPDVFARAFSSLETIHGSQALARVGAVFREEFPSGPDGARDRGDEERLLLGLVLLWLQNANTAAEPFRPLFHDGRLARETAYDHIVRDLSHFFEAEPRFGPKSQTILGMLRSPAIAEPDSLPAQLEFIRREWGSLLEDELIAVLGALDLIEEEQKPRIPGPGPPQAMRIEALGEAPERYSTDQAWMPELVLLAKNALVWLDQLSRAYGRAITRFDEIPGEELDRLAARGFTGLWLIGIWERSPASRRIKTLCGDSESGASAYSIFEYRIADGLGGKAAFEKFREQAFRRGIRLGADMVPNHTGIVSHWVTEHPEWFISSDHPPYPSYTFNGPDLSHDGRVGVFLEDHYYAKTDAAVVFKRLDRVSGTVSFICHGNDGTLMPWNDTAQLNYLNPSVREAVMDTILHVARLCPLIRFDAAMTLTKMHYQRLWFPEPGSGGAVPSRAEHALTKERFDELMPCEFWREVVDRVAAEAPDTLLLAEAFWLTEGYFVRTLGMHRVYNSAFMNMLREEDNAGYRKLVKDTLAFDPEILKRYVNFMNNPDEEPAVVQFGKGGKYFGICTVMATMPGLPMFGHGQVEGLAEKYGAEFTAPRWDERQDDDLVARHGREIFPLLKKRKLFAGVDEFQFYDFVTDAGVDENVLAYTNRWGGERTLVVYHNRWGSTTGVLRESAPRVFRLADGGTALRRGDLVTALRIGYGTARFLRFRDSIAGLEYLLATADLETEGLRLELGAYEYRVFLEFQELEDTSDGSLESLAMELAGRGVPSLDYAWTQLRLRTAHDAFRAVLHPHVIRVLMEVALVVPEWAPELLQTVEARVARLCDAICDAVIVTGEPRVCANHARHVLDRALTLVGPDAGRENDSVDSLLQGIRRDAVSFGMLAAFTTLGAVRRLAADGEGLRFRNDVIPDGLIASTLQALGADETQAGDAVAILRILEAYQDVIEGLPAEQEAVSALVGTILLDSRSHGLLRLNEYEDTRWFNRETLEELLRWIVFSACLHGRPDEGGIRMETFTELYAATVGVAHESGYRLDVFLRTLESGSFPRPGPRQF
ncbi:alpha-amylase [Candidatus Fermentibacteria bacterium]|nr:alpha-amylase [Candidatus Fermentibacteria bacterium]